MSLRALPTEPELETSTDRLIEQFYTPALSHSVSYDRGVGYFTSAWLRMAGSGLAQLASNGGRARVLASPKLDRDDCAAIARGVDARTDPVLLRSLKEAISELAQDLETNTLVAMAWMLADNLLDFRIAVPTGDLDGDFHDKFGILWDAEGNGVSFHGSQNDSQRAFRNYEAISVFYSWVDAREYLRVKNHQARFDRLWDNGDSNLRVYDMPDAIRRNLLQYVEKSPRPYAARGAATEDPASRKWRHQAEALRAFLAAKHGILEMATGTGKTRTSIQILEELIARDQVSTAIVAAHGTDLLDQWHKELIRRGCTFPVSRAYNTHREAQSYINDPGRSILLTSRMNLADIVSRLPREMIKKAMIICDEVHGMGSPALVAALSGKITPFAFRLGLSATPDREYDEAGNEFIECEIGPVIFRFDLQTAIQRSILCPLDYIELEYEFSDEDKADVAAVTRRLLTQLITQSLDGLREHVRAATNEKLAVLAPSEALRVTRIGGALELEASGLAQKEGVSEGQSLAVAYAFLTSLLADAPYRLPFIVDSPAVSLDTQVRREVGELIPDLFGQMIMFVISSEREGFADAFYNRKGVRFLTIWRNSATAETREGLEPFRNFHTLEGAA